MKLHETWLLKALEEVPKKPEEKKEKAIKI